jgi:hypothetical protein
MAHPEVMQRDDHGCEIFVREQEPAVGGRIE